ncbi:universal stress protein [Dongshaea marina]|uniref:universal stress protein n=1 Tax=Dongshaea marina TaxID=2047966 RepID=UPI000D3E7ADA|nr:universal stress protein [Dongshaea marina]
MYKHVLVAADLSKESKSLIEKAATIARSNSAKLSVVHVTRIPENMYAGFPGVVNLNVDNFEHRLLDERATQMHQLLAEINYPCDQQLVVSGNLTDEICQAIGDYEIDLLVCGHHHTLYSAIASSARKLMQHAPCDMLVVPIVD